MDLKEFSTLKNNNSSLNIFKKISEKRLQELFSSYQKYAKAEKWLKFSILPIVLIIITHNLFLAGKEVKLSTIDIITNYGGIYLAVFGVIVITILIIQIRAFRSINKDFRETLKKFDFEEKVNLQDEFNSIVIPIYGGQGAKGLTHKETLKVIELSQKKKTS